MAPESSFQIGAIERLHQTIAGMMRAMLLGSNLGYGYWSDAILHSICLKTDYVINPFKNKLLRMRPGLTRN